MNQRLILNLIRSHSSKSEAEFAEAVECLASDEEAGGDQTLAREIRSAYRSIGGSPVCHVNQGAETSVQSIPSTCIDACTGLVECREPRVTLDDVVLSNQGASVVRQIISEWESPDVLPNGINPTGSLFITGPSGCGKTMVAEAIADALRIPLAVVRSDRLVSSSPGQSGANIQRVFDTVRDRRCVLFFDNFESVGGDRSNLEDTGEIRRMMASLMQCMDSVGEGLLIIAATDLPDIIDPSIIRRFDRTLALDLPDESQITRMVAMFCRRHGIDDCGRADMVAHIATGMSFADVERLMKNAVRDSIVSTGEVVLDGPGLVKTMGGPWEVAARMREGGSTLRDIERETGIPRSTLSYRFGKGEKR